MGLYRGMSFSFSFPFSFFSLLSEEGVEARSDEEGEDDDNTGMRVGQGGSFLLLKTSLTEKGGGGGAYCGGVVFLKEPEREEEAGSSAGEKGGVVCGSGMLPPGVEEVSLMPDNTGLGPGTLWVLMIGVSCVFGGVRLLDEWELARAEDVVLLDPFRDDWERERDEGTLVLGLRSRSKEGGQWRCLSKIILRTMG